MKTQVFQEILNFFSQRTRRHRRGVFFVTLLMASFLNVLNAQENDDFYFYDNEGITVTGTRQTTQQMTVIGKEEIDRRASSDLVNLLHESLGLNIVRYGAYGNQAYVTLRGLDSKRVAFLINGIPANTSTDGMFDINQIDLNSIERIEVIYGGSDSRYNVSGAMGGVVNIITADRQNPGWQFNFSFSNTSTMPDVYFDTQNYSLSALYGSESFSFSANTFINNAQNHFSYKDYLGQSMRRENNEVLDLGASFSAIWELHELTKLIASANFYYGDKNIPNGFYYSTDNQKDTASGISLLIDVPINNNLSTEASFTWYFSRLSYAGKDDWGVDKDSLHDQNRLMVLNRWNWSYNNQLTLKSGFDYCFISLDSTEISNRSRHDGGLFLTAEYKLTESILIIPSLKMVFTNIGSENMALIPKLGILWNVADSITIKNNYFRSFKYPEFNDLFWQGDWGTGNPNLRPEDGWGADFGIDWQITRNTRWENVLFAQWLIDSIHWDYDVYPSTPKNFGKAVFIGLDTNINFEIPVSIGKIEKIVPSISYKYLLSFMLDDGRTFSSNVRVPYSPEHTFGLSLDVIWRTGSFTISGFYEGVRYHPGSSDYIKLEPYFLLNAGANQQIGDNITAFVNLHNILNWSYRSFYGAPPYMDYPMPGFMVTLGIKIRI